MDINRPFLAFEAILEPDQVVSLIDLLGQAVKEAQGYKHGDGSGAGVEPHRR
ncbi:MAG: hypothetical protein LC799_03535 [Actinobacteria bacterium]|nr:hypothetical protein [Actinomycetota bacterium]